MISDGQQTSKSGRCAICNETFRLDNCVVDEQGRAVHKSCYLSAVTGTRHTKYDEVEELLQQARELRETADRLVKTSDALVEAYKQLMGQTKVPKGDTRPLD